MEQEKDFLKDKLLEEGKQGRIEALLADFRKAIAKVELPTLEHIINSKLGQNNQRLLKFAEEFKKSGETMGSFLKKYDWLAILENFFTLYDLLKAMPEFNLHKDLETQINDIYIQYGRYDLPNKQEAVALNDPAWVTIKYSNILMTERYLLQQAVDNENFARILHKQYSEYIRVAQGTLEAMQEKLARLNSPEFYRPGDIIYIDRDDFRYKSAEIKRFLDNLRLHNWNLDLVTVPVPIYAHAGIYIGKGQVIHFAGQGDLIGEKTIHQCSLNQFLECARTKQSNKEIYVMHFPGDGQKPYKLYQDTSNLKFNLSHVDVFMQLDYKDIKCFSPAETIARAKALTKSTDYGQYDFLENNCEHFAFYCKTDMKFSLQASNLKQAVEKVADMLEKLLELMLKRHALVVEVMYKLSKQGLKNMT